MAYTRGQHNVSYDSHYAQRGNRSHSNLSAVQPEVNQFSGTYSWGYTADPAGSTAWEKSYEQVDYSNYEHAETEPQEGYEQEEAAGYGSSWQGSGGSGGKKWQDSQKGGGGGKQWHGEGRDKSGSQWQGEDDSGTQWQGEDDSGLHLQGQGRGGLRGDVGTYRPGHGRGNSGTQWQGEGEDDSVLYLQGQGRGSLRADVGTYRPGHGRGKSGTQWQGEGEDDSVLYLQGQGRGGLRADVGTYRPGHGRGNSRTQWQGNGEDDSGLHWQGQGRGGLRRGVGKYRSGLGRGKSGTEWQGDGEDDSGLHWQGQGKGGLRGDADTYEPGQGRGKSGTQWLDQGREDTELLWQDEGRDDGDFQWQDGGEQGETQWHDQGVDDDGFQWQDEGAEPGETQWLDEGVDQSGLDWRGKGRDDGGFQWQDERGEQGEKEWLDQGGDDGGLHWHDQGRDDSGFQWQGGRDNSGSQWQNQGDDDIGAQWQDQESRQSKIRWQGRGNLAGFRRGRGSRNQVGRGTRAVDITRIDVTSDAPGFVSDSQADRNVNAWEESGQKGTYLSSVVLKYYGSSTDNGGIGRGRYTGSSARGGGSRGRRGVARGVNIEVGSRGGRGMARGVNIEVARGGWGQGRGGGRGRPFQSSPTVADDNTAGQTSVEESERQHPEGELTKLIKKWQTFTKKFADCGNAISNVECSLTSSKLHALSLDFDCKFLAKCGNYSVFSAVLKIIKKSNSKNIPVESVFLARSQGLNKKSAKLNCYEEAYKVLQNANAEVIMNQKDVAEKDLRQQVQLNYSNNPDEFLETLKGVTSSNLGNEASQQPQEDKKESAIKRSSSASAAVPAAKKPRKTDFPAAEMMGNKQLSLVPTKKLDVLMNPADPLVEKLEMLKKLLKEEGITKLHIVPKIDQLAYKSAILIQNVYRIDDVTKCGFEIGTYVYCEVYFDDVYMTRGPPHNKKHIATQQAYSNLAGQLYSRPLNVLANNPRIWTPFMALELDVHHVVTKWHGKDNDSLLTSNLLNMKQMMQSVPDITIPIEQMVLTEHDTDKTVENMFKYLELSATRNLMLLECEIMRNPDLTFTCTLSLQGKILASRVHATKNAAKRICSEIAINKLKKTQDIIFVKTGMVGRKITKSELLLSAMKKKALGEPPGKIFKKMPDYREDVSDENEFHENRENLPENVKARPLYPWIAAAIYEILDEYYQKITLEDLMLDLEDMPKSQRDIISSCAAKMGLRMVTKTKSSYIGPVLRRTVTAQEMDKILQLQGGESGRYKLVSCKNPLSKEELQKFRNQCLEAHKKLVEARTHDTPDEDPEHLSDMESQLVDSGSSDNKRSTGNRQQQTRDTSTRPSSHKVRRPRQSAHYISKFEPRTPAPLGYRPFGLPPRPHMMPGFRPMMDPYMFNNPFDRY